MKPGNKPGDDDKAGFQQLHSFVYKLDSKDAEAHNSKEFYITEITHNTEPMEHWEIRCWWDLTKQ